MRIGNTNGNNYTSTLGKKNLMLSKALLDSNNKKNQTTVNLLDVFSKSNQDDDLLFNYASMLKNPMNGNLRKTPTIDGSLWIDPSKPFDKTPKRECIQMEAVTKDQIDFAQNYINDRVNYSKMFLSGLGDEVFNKFLSDNGVALPENAKFDISVDGYGKVTVTGLDDEELTNKLQDAMSYNFSFIRSDLTMFEESRRTIESNATDGGKGMSYDQHWKMQVNSVLLTDYGVGLTELSLDKNGIIQGLPDELHEKIYGDRKDMSREERQYFDLLRDKTAYLLEKGTNNIPTYNVTLTYQDSKVKAHK